MLVGKEKPVGGPSEDDGSGFVRRAWIYCFLLSTVFYICLVFALFTVEIFADRRGRLLVNGLVVYLPTVAIWGLTRWFNSRE